jgi:hypothetical protein
VPAAIDVGSPPHRLSLVRRAGPVEKNQRHVRQKRGRTQTMARLHISQDETGFWQLSFEDDDGTLTLISHQFPSPDHLIEDARELVKKGRVADAAIIIGPPGGRRGLAESPAAAPRRYVKPAPRKAVDL